MKRTLSTRQRDWIPAQWAMGSDLCDQAPVGLFSVVAGGRIVEANATGVALLGLDRAQLRHRRLHTSLVPTSRLVFADFLERVFASSATQVCEIELRKADGSSFWADARGTRSPQPGNAPQQCRLALADDTGLHRVEEAQRRLVELAQANKEANREIARRETVETSLRQSELTQRELLAKSRVLHEQLRQVTRQVLLAQEEERKAISRELHDEVAQMLAGINVHLAVLKQDEGIDRRSLRRRVARTQRLVGHSVQVVHRYARKLRPALLDDLGLIPALRSYIKEMPGRKGLRIRFSAFSAVEALDNARRTVLYRVALEALTNVTRHARASVVSIRIQRRADLVRLTIHDDGKSFQAERLLAAPTNGRLGLLGMRERVEMVGGNLFIESAPGQGTTVRAELPFHPSGGGSS